MVRLRVLFRVAPICVLAFLSITAQTPQTPTLKPAAPQLPTAEKTPPTVPAAQPHKLEKADLEAFFDGIIPLQLERSDVAGASVLVIKDGQVLLEKGYGYSDVKQKKPVDPNTTMFRLASISKLFTWISVMQLAEQGKLNIDADVNQYLDFQIAPAFGKPITLRNLMTHTGGFEEEGRDVIVTDPKRSPTLRDFLIQNQPRRMYPPGTIPAYSNYGVGLAGYIVQRVSGEPFENYVTEHIFQPLGMTHSSFSQPLPGTLTPLVSEGYDSPSDKPVIGFELFNPAPAGGISSTASDMGRFGQALLNGGELDGKRILKSETLNEMWTRQFAASNQMPAMDMGFYQTWRNGLRFIGHGGDLVAFHSLFAVEPKEKLIIFVSYNSVGGERKTRPELLRSFADRYYPETSEPELRSASASELKAMEGTYQSTRRADSTKVRLGDLLDYVHTTGDPKEGVLKLDQSKDLRGHIHQWKPLGNGLWRAVDGQELLFGIQDDRGRVIRLASDFPGVQLERVPWYENDKLILSLLGASMAIVLVVLLASLIRLGRRIFMSDRAPLQEQPGTLWLTAGPRAAAFAWIAVAIWVVLLFVKLTVSTSLPPSHAADKYFVLCNLLVGLAILLSIFAAVSGVRIWGRVGVRWITKAKFTLVALACVFLCWFSIHWNLIGPAHRF
jgi:CubicO group peptidase (beta-lactamase class C family)